MHSTEAGGELVSARGREAGCVPRSGPMADAPWEGPSVPSPGPPGEDGGLLLRVRGSVFPWLRGLQGQGPLYETGVTAGGRAGFRLSHQQLCATAVGAGHPTHLRASTCHLHSSREILPWWRAGPRTGSPASVGWWRCLEQPEITPRAQTAATWPSRPLSAHRVPCLACALTPRFLGVRAAHSSPRSFSKALPSAGQVGSCRR